MKYNKLLCIYFITLCALFPTLLQSQVDTAWVRRYNGPDNGRDEACSIKVDAQGNVYVTGSSVGSGTNQDYATVKYNTSGVQQWVRRYNGLGNSYDYAYALAVDAYTNVYVTGSSYGSGTLADYATVKYNALGIAQWVARYNGPVNSNDRANSIAVDGIGNVYVTGYTTGVSTYHDYTTIKYNSSGDTFWVRRYDGPINAYDDAYSLAVDGSGYVYVTGSSRGSGTDYDYATIKYSPAGTQQWVQRYDGPGNGYEGNNSLVVDGQGNICVTGESQGSGTSYDYATIKYNSAGTQQWVQRYNGPGNSIDGAKAIAVDGSGNVYVTGESYGGAGTNYDYATIKYNSSGVQQWVRRYDGPVNGYDCANALYVDGQGNVYVTGYSRGSGIDDDYATVKYNASGVLQWVQRYNAANASDYATAIAVDNSGNVYVTGYSWNPGFNYDYATIKYAPAGAVEENRSLYSVDRLPLEIFPNPARSYLNISSSLLVLPFMLKLYDVSGKQVKSEEVRGKNYRISLDGIKNGIYFIKVGNEMLKEKLVILR